MAEKLITKSFERLLDKGKHRGFITYEELGKSLGKRGKSSDNLEKAIIIIFDNKIKHTACCPINSTHRQVINMVLYK